ncbi:MBL fold metallo-hydrolase [Adhaeribacter aquaticus]|uniref:MBL fold metallo-hydrolase n=1 Tax=Adhaeribacter aquaticus TaxID=299567 RepID=UPI0003FB8C63|nr:MBL fold metallo-hydrolase [Adhaeribacter aquaticus]
MQIKFLGTGGAFEPQYFNSAAILNFSGSKILIDAGFTVYPRLVELNLILKIEYILLSHLHNDHCGSLANILLHQHHNGADRKPVILYQTEDFKNQIEEFLAIQLKDPEKYADFAPLPSVPGIIYLDTYGRHSEQFQTYSFLVEEAGERIVYSGDLRDTDFLFAHILTLPDLPTTVFHDIAFHPENTGHAYYTMLMPYQEQYRIYGYHCDPTKNPADNTVPLVYYQPDFMY